MKISSDDPKLTAYALGELDKNEVEQIERELQNSPELRKAIAEVRETAALLKRELSNEPALSLSDTQKSDVLAKTKPDNIIPFPRQKVFKAIGIGAIAASVALVVTWQLGIVPQKTDKNQQAISNSEFKYAQNAISQAHKKTLDAEKNIARDEAQSTATPKPEPALIVNEVAPITPSKPGEKTVTAEVAFQEVNDLSLNGISVGKSFNSIDVTEKASKETSVILKDGQEHGIPMAKAGGNFTQFVPQAQDLSSGLGSIPNRSLRLSPNGTGGGGGGGGIEELSRVQVNRGIAPKSVPVQNYSKNQRAVGFDWYEGNRLLVRETVEVQKGWGRSETARYPKYAENDFQSVSQEPLSTFSIDVDTASYANVRRFLNENRLPPGDAVRIEELINYFSYNYPQPKGDEPFSANLEVAGCPWNSQHRLVRIGLKGKEIAQGKRPPSNFVFIIDVSGSMSPSERLPLIKQALRMLVKRMTENDRIAIVVYASSSGVVLESTSCANKEKILAVLDRLEAGGSTNGGEGVQRAYALAEENFIKGGVNRVILCTDGDFNVGITDQSELVNLIQRKARSGVFLSALGVGTDNYKDALMQKLADKGNGNYHYIDTMEEAQKVLIQQMNGTLVTIAKDVKIQIEFNPARVSSYRLIGYEKRILAAEDFNNDKKDAGEIGAGHTVTALYEIVPTNGREDGPRGEVDDLKYQKPTPTPKREINNDNPELLTLKLRYKKPDGNTSKLSETTVTDSGKSFSQASSDFKFASAVGGFGMILKNSEHKGGWTFKSTLDVAEKSKGDDKEGYRAEFINLVKKAKSLHQQE
jgi:Ca-activated chloride channel homolog